MFFITIFFLATCRKSSVNKLDPVIDTPFTSEERGEIDPIAMTSAQKGGLLQAWGGAFPKSLNYWLDGNTLSGEITSLMFEPLVTLHSTENRATGILAESWSKSEDQRTFIFNIHPLAKWSDGQPITAEDVQFYYDVIMDPKNLTSVARVSLSKLNRPEVINTKTLKVTAKENHWSNFWDAGGLYAFPKHVWAGEDFNKINFEFPVVSGPYAMLEVKTNRYVLMQRRSDWWGRSLKYSKGKFNFDYIRYKFVEDQTKVLEALRKGEFDAYAVYTASIWERETNFPEITKGWVVKERVFNREPRGFQGIAMNMRRPAFQDVRVREALSLLINRERMNEKLMYNQYFLLNSYYPDLYPNNRNPDIAIRKFDPDRARALFQAAGWKPAEDGVLTKDGKKFVISFLMVNTDLPHINIYINDLKSVGVTAKVEQLSLSSLRKRIENFDFDLYWVNWSGGRLRDPEGLWLGKYADEAGSNNLAGVNDDVVNSLIQEQMYQSDLNKRNEILKRLDKRLNEIIPYILLWQSDNTRLLFWNKFGTPKYVLDKYNREDSIVTYWWLDPEKELMLKNAQASKKDTLPIPARDVFYRD